MKFNSTHARSQAKSTAALAGPRPGRGQKATDERGFVLPLLRQADREGISRRDFLTGSGLLAGRLVTQIGRLINQLEKEGYVFKHEKKDGSQFVSYVLVSEPIGPGNPVQRPQRSGWKAERFAYGRNSQPVPEPVAVPQTQTLFDMNGNTSFIDRETGRRL